MHTQNLKHQPQSQPTHSILAPKDHLSTILKISTPISSPSHTQYSKIIKKQNRNGTYIGTTINNLKNGLGLLILDNSQLIFANWQNDKLQGNYIYISNQLRIFGKISNSSSSGSNSSSNSMQGFNVIKILQPLYKQQVQNRFKYISNKDRIKRVNPMTIYGMYKCNRLYGKCVVVIRDCIYICCINVNNNNNNNTNTNNQFRYKQNNRKQAQQDYLQILSIIKITRNQLPQTLKNIFPYISIFQLTQFLTNMIQKQIALNNSGQLKQQLSKYRPQIRKYPVFDPNPNLKPNSSNIPMHTINTMQISSSNQDMKIFYGYCTNKPPTVSPILSRTQYQNQQTIYNKNIQFGFILHNQQLISMGQHQNGYANGLATVYECPNKIWDGMFRSGRLMGIGICMDLNINKYVYGRFNKLYEKSADKLGSINVNMNMGMNMGMGMGTNTNRYFTNSTNPNSNPNTTINNNTNNYTSIKSISTKSINVQIIKQGINWPQSIIKQYRRQYHIKSIYYDNGYAQIAINVPIQDIQKLDLLLIRKVEKGGVGVGVGAGGVKRINDDQANAKINSRFSGQKQINRRRHTQIQPDQYRTYNKNITHSNSHTNSNSNHRNRIKTQHNYNQNQDHLYQSTKPNPNTINTNYYQQNYKSTINPNTNTNTNTNPSINVIAPIKKYIQQQNYYTRNDQNNNKYQEIYMKKVKYYQNNNINDDDQEDIEEQKHHVYVNSNSNPSSNVKRITNISNISKNAYIQQANRIPITPNKQQLSKPSRQLLLQKSTNKSNKSNRSGIKITQNKQYQSLYSNFLKSNYDKQKQQNKDMNTDMDMDRYRMTYNNNPSTKTVKKQQQQYINKYQQPTAQFQIQQQLITRQLAKNNQKQNRIENNNNLNQYNSVITPPGRFSIQNNSNNNRKYGGIGKDSSMDKMNNISGMNMNINRSYRTSYKTQSQQKSQFMHRRTNTEYQVKSQMRHWRNK